MDAENRAAAQSLVRLGAAALPDINAAFDSIAKSGSSSKFAPNAGWLLYAYAKIEGPADFPRLRKMHGDPNFGFLLAGLDAAAAASLDLTSYVSSSRQPIPESSTSCEGPSPQETLDRFILAWERKDHERRTDITAVGYRFDPGSPWPNPPQMHMIEDVELDTVFKDASGKDCGSQRIRFLSPDLQIASGDISGLQRVIAHCAEKH